MITVLMAAYQGKKYLEQQMDSILAQTLQVRVIVSDDGSDDGTRKLLEQYAQWYPGQVVLAHRPRGELGACKTGVPAAAKNFFWLMSYAARQGISDYIMLSDQDDVWFHDKVRIMIGRMKQLERSLGSSCPILLHSDMEVVDKDLNLIHTSFAQYARSKPYRTSFAQILVENPVTGGAVMMNRSLLERAAELPDSCCMHDWWLALTASCFGVIEYVPKALYQYRQHDGNVLGAKATGSFSDLKQRLGRRRQVEDNYRRMMTQAAAFRRRFHGMLNHKQKATLQAYLALSGQSAAGRFGSIVRNGFRKSSVLQTLAMCITMPRMERSRKR